ncbi:unnamed protein product [Gordionus sp. m RMFG-2023]|uniref:uncharacterized protein LOC135924913 isoform X2 n=1 Tax=Gordionus sp. m RMFG-2023 TaxID=3053472 RepID=UPI0030E54BD4
MNLLTSLIFLITFYRLTISSASNVTIFNDSEEYNTTLTLKNSLSNLIDLLEQLINSSIIRPKSAIANNPSNSQIIGNDPKNDVLDYIENELDNVKRDFDLQRHDDDLNYEPVKMVCYFTGWDQWKQPPYKFLTSSVDPFLCTHIIYAFSKISPDWKMTVYEHNAHEQYRELVNLKNTNPKLKIMLAIGGWTHGGLSFSLMAEDPVKRLAFITDVVQQLIQFNFDGFDLDWEYPGNTERGGRKMDKDNFLTLVKELRQAFNSSGKKLLLTAAVSAGKDKIDFAYHIPELNKYLDFFNLLSYDFHGAWENVTGLNSPYNSTGDYYSLTWAIDYWIKNGVDRSKLIPGMATYGRSFTLHQPLQDESTLISDTNKSALLNLPAKGPGKAGKLTLEPGVLSYYEICRHLKKDKWTKTWDDLGRVPYAFKDDQWVGYDDKSSLDHKINYVLSKCLGGAMVWDLALDDHAGINCEEGKYPLIKHIKSRLSTYPNTCGSTSSSRTSVSPICPYSSISPVPPVISPEISILPYPTTIISSSTSALDAKTPITIAPPISISISTGTPYSAIVSTSDKQNVSNATTENIENSTRVTEMENSYSSTPVFIAPTSTDSKTLKLSLNPSLAAITKTSLYSDLTTTQSTVEEITLILNASTSNINISIPKTSTADTAITEFGKSGKLIINLQPLINLTTTNRPHTNIISQVDIKSTSSLPISETSSTFIPLIPIFTKTIPTKVSTSTTWTSPKEVSNSLNNASTANIVTTKPLISTSTGSVNKASTLIADVSKINLTDSLKLNITLSTVVASTTISKFEPDSTKISAATAQDKNSIEDDTDLEGYCRRNWGNHKFKCTKEGSFQDKFDCGHYYECLYNQLTSSYIQFYRACADPTKTMYDPIYGVCIWKPPGHDKYPRITLDKLKLSIEEGSCQCDAYNSGASKEETITTSSYVVTISDEAGPKSAMITSPFPTLPNDDGNDTNDTNSRLLLDILTYNTTNLLGNLVNEETTKTLIAACIAAIKKEFTCTGNGLFVDHSDCRYYWECVQSYSGFTRYRRPCSMASNSNLQDPVNAKQIVVFDPEIGTCVWNWQSQLFSRKSEYSILDLKNESSIMTEGSQKCPCNRMFTKEVNEKPDQEEIVVEEKEPYVTLEEEIPTPAKGTKVLFCYFTGWDQWKRYPYNFTTANVNPLLCTHLIYAFLYLAPNFTVQNIEHNTEEQFEQLNALKIINPDLKIIAGVGGWNAGAKVFSDLARNKTTRDVFVKSAKEYLLKRNLDGIDIDWEYPGHEGQGGRLNEDKINFPIFMKELREELDKDQNNATNPKKLLITAAVSAGETNIDNGYDIPKLSKYFDFIAVMTYDMNGLWQPNAGHNSPLYHSKSDFSLSWAMKYWHKHGTPLHKLLIGIPTYGRLFKLRHHSNNKPGDAIIGPGPVGPYTSESGILSNYEICQIIHNNTLGWTKKFDNDSLVPYAFKDNLWLSYENKESVILKAKYLIKHNYGGAMVWNLALDDFGGSTCSTQKFPLISTAAKLLNIHDNFINAAEAKISSAVGFRTDDSDSLTDVDKFLEKHPKYNTSEAYPGRDIFKDSLKNSNISLESIIATLVLLKSRLKALSENNSSLTDNDGVKKIRDDLGIWDNLPNLNVMISNLYKNSVENINNINNNQSVNRSKEDIKANKPFGSASNTTDYNNIEDINILNNNASSEIFVKSSNQHRNLYKQNTEINHKNNDLDYTKTDMSFNIVNNSLSDVKRLNTERIQSIKKLNNFTFFSSKGPVSIKINSQTSLKDTTAKNTNVLNTLTIMQYSQTSLKDTTTKNTNVLNTYTINDIRSKDKLDYKSRNNLEYHDIFDYNDNQADAKYRLLEKKDLQFIDPESSDGITEQVIGAPKVILSVISNLFSVLTNATLNVSENNVTKNVNKDENIFNVDIKDGYESKDWLVLPFNYVNSPLNLTRVLNLEFKRPVFNSADHNGSIGSKTLPLNKSISKDDEVLSSIKLIDPVPFDSLNNIPSKQLNLSNILLLTKNDTKLVKTNDTDKDKTSSKSGLAEGFQLARIVYARQDLQNPVSGNNYNDGFDNRSLSLYYYYADPKRSDPASSSYLIFNLSSLNLINEDDRSMYAAFNRHRVYRPVTVSKEIPREENVDLMTKILRIDAKLLKGELTKIIHF